MVLWQASNYLVPLFTFPYLARVLGPESYGLLGFCIVFVGYSTIVIDWGFNVTGTKAVALAGDDRTEVGRIVSEIVCARLSLCVISICATFFVVSLHAGLRENVEVITLAFLFPIGSAISLNWCLQGMRRFGIFAAAAIAARITSVPLLLLFVKSKEDIDIAALIQTIPGVIGALISIYLVLVAFKIPLSRPRFTSIAHRLADSFWIFVGNLNHGVYTGSATLALGLVSNPLQLGIFAASDRIRTVAQGVIAPVSQALFPTASQLSKETPALASRMMWRTLLLQGVATSAVSVSLYLFADVIVGILVGSAFTEAAQILRIISVMPTIVGINNVLSVQGLLAKGKNGAYARATAGTAVFNVPATVFCAQNFGARGVAISVVVTELLLCGLLTFSVMTQRRMERQ